MDGSNVIFSTTTVVSNGVNAQNLHAPSVSLLSIYEHIAIFFYSFQPGHALADFSTFVFFFKLIVTFVSLVFLCAIIYVVVKHHEHMQHEKQKELAERLASPYDWVSSAAAANAASGPGMTTSMKAAVPEAVSHDAPAATPSAVANSGVGSGAPTLASSVAMPAGPSASEPADETPSVEDVLNMARNGTAGVIVGSAPKMSDAAIEDVRAKQARSVKWQRVADHAASESENDWRLAILEADILLDELLDLKHAHGNTIGDKLKSMTDGDMPSLQKAWEAHLVRNQIAHEGSDFFLSQREARRVVGLYETVLREGGYM